MNDKQELIAECKLKLQLLKQMYADRNTRLCITEILWTLSDLYNEEKTNNNEK